MPDPSTAGDHFRASLKANAPGVVLAVVSLWAAALSPWAVAFLGLAVLVVYFLVAYWIELRSNRSLLRWVVAGLGMVIVVVGAFLFAKPSTNGDPGNTKLLTSAAVSPATSPTPTKLRGSPKPRLSPTPQMSPTRTPGPMYQLSGRAHILSMDIGNLLMHYSARSLRRLMDKKFVERFYPDRTDAVLFEEMRNRYRYELQTKVMAVLVEIGKARPLEEQNLLDIHKKAADPKTVEELGEVSRYLTETAEKLHDD
jgi:hypothetical protein